MSDLFPSRSPPHLLNAAAVGGLVPAPARRHRGAFPHLLCSMAAQGLTSLVRAFVAHYHQRTSQTVPPDILFPSTNQMRSEGTS